MPMSPEVIRALSQVKPGGKAGVAKPPMSGPAASQMLTPQAPAGALMKAKLQAAVVVKVLEQILVSAGSMSDIGKAALDAIKTLTKVIGKQEGDSEELQPMEQKLLAGSMGPSGPPGAGAAPPAAPPGGPAPGGGAMPPPGGAGAMPPMAA